jgi:hypothetical protein
VAEPPINPKFLHLDSNSYNDQYSQDFFLKKKSSSSQVLSTQERTSKKYAEKFAPLFLACTHTLIHLYFSTNYRPFHKEAIDTNKL